METGMLRETALKLAAGGYDLHVHTAPSHFKRALDDMEATLEAEEIGMNGILLKSHYSSTAERAVLVNRLSGSKTRAYGGIVLNRPAGGLNPYAVESALRMGAVIVWMPTRDALNCLRYGDMPGDFFKRPGISILTDGGSLKPAVNEILDVVRSYGASLATGHLSVEESVILCREGRRRGVNMILTHPDWARTVVPLEIQLMLAEEGVLIEKNWLNIAEGQITPREMARSIKALGYGRVYMATDRGQAGAEHPAKAMLRFIEAMLGEGVPERQIKNMVCEVPEKIGSAVSG